MALYLDEEEVWKCSKHPAKRRRSGICPICLRDRLVSLCPDCANERPCSCYATSSSSSSSSSSSFSRFSVAVDGDGDGRVHNLIDSEPSLRRSRSMAFPFLRSKSRFSGGDKVLDPDSRKNSPAQNRSKPTKSLWSLFKFQKSNRNGVQEQCTKKVLVEDDDDVSKRPPMMMRSRSVAVASVSGSGSGEMRSAAKGRGYWFLPSPIKAFRQPKVSKVGREWPPFHKG